MAAVASTLRALTPLLALQLLRIQGQPMTLATKLRYFADPEFAGLFEPTKGAAA